MSFFACDGPIRLDVVTAIPPDRPAGSGGSGNGASSGAGNVGAGNETSGQAGSMDEGGAAGSGSELGGAGGEEPGPPPWEAPTLYQASFAAFALPGEYIRHQDALGFVTAIDPVTVDAVDATFEVIEAMIGNDDECFSIRRLGGDFNFMRHTGSRIYFNFAEPAPLYLADATFCFRPGLAEPTWVSFESYNYPNRYIRIRDSGSGGNELWVDDNDDSALFAAEATFRVENPFQQPD